MQIGVLGAGMVGRTIAIDLAATYYVTAIDISGQSLQLLAQKNNAIKTIKADLSDYDNYTSLLSGFDFIVCAVPGFMGYKTLEAVIKSKKNVVDISFFREDPLQLDALAKKNQVCAIVDCGVAPGMSNLVLGYYNERISITHFECLVGGLPKMRVKPFEYKAPFSPVDVLEEYTRPARYIENGFVVTRPALSDAEFVDFERIGTLEAFNTDGLRSLLITMSHIPNMIEKTLRYPGHIDLMKALLKAGFLNDQLVNFRGLQISPREFSSAIFFDQWKLGEDEEEFTLMRILIKGTENGKPVTISYHLFDEYNIATQTSSMSRTTGYTATAALNMLINNLFTSKGVFPPELVGKDENCFNFMLNYLKERGVVYVKKII